MKAITMTQFGAPNVLTLSDIPRPIISSEQLLVKVHAIGVNRADILQRRGKYPPVPGDSDILGLEIAGTIVTVGDNVVDWRVGDKVFGLVGGGAYAEYCLLDSQMAMKIPDNWSFEQAAAVPEVFMTANETIFELGQLQQGETLLLHAAASGVGTAALQMAKYIGAAVIASVSNENKKASIKKLGADFVINYKKENLFAKCFEYTNQLGVDVIEDFIGAEYLQQHLALLKMNGRLILVALMRGSEALFDMRLVLKKRLQIKGSVMRTRTLSDKREITQRFVKRWLPILQQGSIHPVVDKVFSFDEVAKAHEYMEANKNIGKIILTVS